MSRLSETLTARAAELEISQTRIAEELGMSQTSISELFSGHVASPRKWREIARILQIDEEEMRQMMIEAGREAGKTTRLPRFVKDLSFGYAIEPAAPAPRPNAIMADQTMPAKLRPGRMIPVLGEAVGGVDGEYMFNGNVIDYVACPPSLEGVANAYAVFVDGESMSPRYKSGETVWVHPNKPPRRGDDVIVQIKPTAEDLPPHGFIKEFVGWSGDRLALKQHNPDSTLHFDRRDVVSIHPIVFAGKY